MKCFITVILLAVFDKDRNGYVSAKEIKKVT
jgi:Ca2+-binding EF-hand superfamily protein